MADVNFSFKLDVEVDTPTNRFESRDHRARALLRKILTKAQWTEYEKYRSVRLLICTSQGLPFRYVEVGVRVPGLILFDKMNRPYEIRNAYPRQDVAGWCPEDLLIAMLLRLRQGALEFIETCCLCRLEPGAIAAIYERTFHLVDRR